MPTVLEFINRIADPEIREKALNAMNDPACYPEPETNVGNIADAIGEGFAWTHTEDGYEYWLYIAKYPPELIPERTQRDIHEDLLKEFALYVNLPNPNDHVTDFLNSKYKEQ